MEVPIDNEKGTPGVVTNYEYSESLLLSLRDQNKSEKRPEYLDNPKFAGVLRLHDRDERTPRKEEDSKNVLTAQRRSFNMGCHMPTVTTEPEQPVMPNTQRVISDRPRSSNGTYGRYGSGRILNRDVSWDYKPADKNETEKEPTFHPNNAGFVRFRDFRDRSNSHNDRRSYFRDLERDKNITGTNQQRSKRFFDSEPNQFSHYHYDRRRTVSDNEPEWFSAGPTSKNDVIELHGFDDEGKKEAEEFKEQYNQKYPSRRNSLNNSIPKDDNNNAAKPDGGSSRKDGQFNFDEFVNWENPPPNQLFDNDNNCLRSVGSRFTQYFRNDKFTRGKQEQFEIRRQHDLKKSPTSLFEFLSQGNFQNLENQGVHSNKQQQTAGPTAQKKILSVDELEKRMRQAELTEGAKKSPRKIVGNNQKQQETFKKLLSQMNDKHSAELLANHANNFQQFVGGNNSKSVMGRQAPTGAEMTNMLQKQTEMLKRPDAQTYMQALARGEVSRQALYQHASNPMIPKDQRDVIINVLNAFNSLTSVASSNYGQNSRPVNNCDTHHFFAYQNQYQKTFAGPNGMQQRLPTVQELQFYADTIKQNVLIKRQLEEERERIRKQPEKVAPTHL